jgi:hypothetical protein
VDLIVATLLGLLMSLALAIAGALLMSLPVMWTWNAVAPHVLGVKSLTWLDALWLSLLCGLLFRTSTTSRTTLKTE